VLFGVFVLTPGLLYLGLPLLFISLIFTVALAAAIHPLAGMLIPLGIGVPMALASRGAEPAPLSSRGRRILLGLAAGLGVSALLSSGIDGIGHTLFGEPCTTSCSEWSTNDDHWLVLAPALALLPLAVAAAATAQRWTVVALATSTAVLAGQAVIVTLFLIGFAFTYG
jgi:hypothetical protein